MKTTLYGMRRAVTCLTAGLALGGTFALAAHAADMYRMTPNSGGGVPAASVITAYSQTRSNVTLSWYGLQGWYNIEVSASPSGPWSSVASVEATNFAGAKTISSPGSPSANFYRLNQANSFTGSGECGSCHGDKYNDFQTTEHSLAYTSASAISNFSLVCRTVGYGQDTGFTNETSTPHLKNVGCENCHGAAGGHKNGDHALIRPAMSLDPLICGSCHQGSSHPTLEEYESSPHAEVLEDISYGFTGGTYFTNTITLLGTNLYGYYVTTNSNGSLKTNATTGIVHSLNGPQTLAQLKFVYDPGQDRAASCGVCHSAAVRMAMLTDYENRLAGKTNPLVMPVAKDAAAWGAACATCHDPHADYNVAQLRNPTRSTNFYTMPTTTDKRTILSTNFMGAISTNVVFYNTTFASLYNPNIQICGQCHNTRGARWDNRAYGLVTNSVSGVSVTNLVYVDLVTNVTVRQVFTNNLGVPYLTNTYTYPYVYSRYATNIVTTSTIQNVTVGVTTNISTRSASPHPTPQYNVLIGIIQDDYLGGTNSPVTHNHTRAANGCATCHVPVYSSGGTNVTGHTFALNTRGCLASGCHGSVPSEFRSTQTSNSNGVNTVVGLLNRWATNAGPALFGSAYTNYMQNAWEFTTPGSLGSTNYRGPSSSDQLKLPDAIKQARFNIYQVKGDGSWGIHNLSFISRLVSDANTKVSSAIIGLTNAAYFTASSTTGYTPFSVPFLSYGSGVLSYSWNFGDGGTSTAANPTYIYSAPGTNTVTLTVTTAGGPVTYVRTNYIRAYNLPVVSFVGSPVTGDAPLTVTFTNTSSSTGSVTSWRWTFGSQQITTNATAYTYTFTNPGTFNISLRATTPVGNVTTTTNAYIVATTNAAVFVTTNAVTGYAPMTNLFQVTGSGATSYSWNFGDGGTSTDAAPTHVYSSAGTNTVSLTVATAGGPKTWTRTAFIKTYDRPAVSFTGGPLTGVAPVTVTFTNTSLNTNSVTAWRWTFGSQSITTNALVYTYTFTNAGSFDVQLRATTPVGTITVTNAAYVVGITNPALFVTTNATSGYAPLTNTFRVLGAGATSYSWDFGDGGTSTDASPTHVYSSAGTNTVTLTVATVDGPKVFTRTAYIKAYNLPMVTFAANALSGPAPLSVTFTNTSINTNSVTSWRWTFGTQTVTTNAPIYTYVFTNVVPASYNIQLRATTPLGTITTTNLNYISVTP